MTGEIHWVSLAFGVGHPPETSSRWNVYEFAYQRLHGALPPTRR